MANQRLSPTARLTLDALNAGPGNVHELCERTGRSRSTTDKAIGDLATAGLIVKVDDGGDPADGAPARWQLADPAAAEGETTGADPADDDHAAAPATDPSPDEVTGQALTAGPPEPPADPQPASAQTAADPAIADPAADVPAASQAATDGEATPDGEQRSVEPEPAKLCRGCQAQLPKICHSCWQKTPTYCGTCRRTMPQVRRGEPGEPVILSNGLPKLRPGELEAMVLTVMQEQPLPAFAGIIGWTGSRVAVHLPGRSTGAINNALEKLERNGVAELVGDKPMRFKLKDAEQPETDTDSDSGSDAQDQARRPDATTPAAGTA
jgi:hypothetical protein